MKVFGPLMNQMRTFWSLMLHWTVTTTRVAVPVLNWNTSSRSAVLMAPLTIFSDMPGPEVAVSAFLPAKEAPRAEPIPAISSSAWSTAPPYFQMWLLRNCITSEDGVVG